MKRIRLGIIGGGAVTQQYHLPASKFALNVEVVALVDKDKRLAKIADKYKIPYFADDHHEIFDLVDGVLIALPHNLHAPVGNDFLKRGIPVLCEKPLATSTGEAKEMLDLSQNYRAPIAVGFMRRFYRSSKEVKRILSSNLLGRIHTFDFEEGSIYGWRTLTGFYFNKKAAGGGVLADTGSHTLDLLLWWLGPNISGFKYSDDNLGGVEANCTLELTISYKDTLVSGRIELSRERVLRNSYRLYGTNGWLEYSPNNLENIALYIGNDKTPKRSPDPLKNMNHTRDVLYYFAKQLCDFGFVVAGSKTPYVDATLPYEAIKLIENCYSSREKIPMPWITHNISS